MLRLLYISSIATIVLAEPQCSNDVAKLLEDGDATFTGKFLNIAVKNNPNKNLIMSPFSVFTPLAELDLYSNGNTSSQILNVLNLPDKTDIRCIFPKLTSDLKAQQNVVLRVASKIYSSDKNPLSKSFLEDTKEIFGAQAETLNFNDPQASANEINQWVEQQTNDRIKNIASPDMFTSDTRLILANAIYFLGNWASPFNDRRTMKRTFYISSDKTVEIPTMYQQTRFNYGEDSNLDCKVLEMFYEGRNFSFVAFLPNKIDGLSDLVKNLQDSNSFYKAYDQTGLGKVNVYLPKMDIESEFDLTDIMQKVGIVDILDPSKSNLTGILETDEPLYISSAKQKAFLKVNEKGTEVAAANVIGISVLSLIEEPIYTFKADHPFPFFIVYNRNIIFSGVFAGN